MPTTDDRAARAHAYGTLLIGLVGQRPDDLDALLALFGADRELIAQARVDDQAATIDAGEGDR